MAIIKFWLLIICARRPGQGAARGGRPDHVRRARMSLSATTGGALVRRAPPGLEPDRSPSRAAPVLRVPTNVAAAMRSFWAAATRSLGEPLAPAGDVLVGTALHRFDLNWPPSSRASALMAPQMLLHSPGRPPCPAPRPRPGRAPRASHTGPRRRPRRVAPPRRRRARGHQVRLSLWGSAPRSATRPPRRSASLGTARTRLYRTR